MAKRKRSAHPTDADFRADLEHEPQLMKGDNEQAVKEEQPIHTNAPQGARSNKMPLIDPREWDLDNIPELKVLPAGSEVKVRITEVITGTDKSGNDYVNVRLDVVDEPNVREFGQFMNIPSRMLSDKRLVSVKRAWKELGEAFDFDLTQPFNPESDWPGAEAWAILGLQKDERYGEQNTINKWSKPASF